MCNFQIWISFFSFFFFPKASKHHSLIGSTVCQKNTAYVAVIQRRDWEHGFCSLIDRSPLLCPRSPLPVVQMWNLQDWSSSFPHLFHLIFQSLCLLLFFLGECFNSIFQPFYSMFLFFVFAIIFLISETFALSERGYFLKYPFHLSNIFSYLSETINGRIF